MLETFLIAHGSRDTIQAIANYERLGGVVGTEEQNAAFTRMFNALRIDRGLPPLDQEDLLAVMYLDDVGRCWVMWRGLCSLEYS